MSKDVILCNDHARPLVFKGELVVKDRTKDSGGVINNWWEYNIYQSAPKQYVCHIVGKSNATYRMDTSEAFYIEYKEEECDAEFLKTKRMLKAGWVLERKEDISPATHGKLLYQLAKLGIDKYILAEKRKMMCYSVPLEGDFYHLRYLSAKILGNCNTDLFMKGFEAPEPKTRDSKTYYELPKWHKREDMDFFYIPETNSLELHIYENFELLTKGLLRPFWEEALRGYEILIVDKT